MAFDHLHCCCAGFKQLVTSSSCMSSSQQGPCFTPAVSSKPQVYMCLLSVLISASLMCRLCEFWCAPQVPAQAQASQGREWGLVEIHPWQRRCSGHARHSAAALGTQRTGLQWCRGQAPEPDLQKCDKAHEAEGLNWAKTPNTSDLHACQSVPPA